jgi:EAL domain-containing protein (putative c-di-GMP-specific phosphodiesterase class I)
MRPAAPRLVAVALVVLALAQAATLAVLGQPIEASVLPALALVSIGGALLIALLGNALTRSPARRDAPADDVSGSTDAVADDRVERVQAPARTAAPPAPALGAELRRAIEGGELRLYLQPKIALGDTGVVGAEALPRWQHPQRGLLLPPEFAPLAERAGLAGELTRWVVNEAARRWEALRGDGVPLRLAVNLRAHDLHDAELPARLDALLARHQVPPQAFCLEVSEGAIAADPARAEAALHELAARGFKLALDGFGAGASSLGALARMPLHELKIDGRFVATLDRDPRDAAVVRAAIRVGHELGWRVVAEGVDSAASWTHLLAWGCDEGQGAHIGAPLPADELPAWCRQWREQHARDDDVDASLPLVVQAALQLSATNRAAPP